MKTKDEIQRKGRDFSVKTESSPISFVKMRNVCIFALPMRLEISSERSPGRRGAVFRFEFRLCERERRGLIGLGWCREGAAGKMMV